MTPTPKTGGLPWPPLIYVSAIAISIILHLLYPLPWLGPPMSFILAPVGWLALLAVAALIFSAIRTMRRHKTTINPTAMPDHLVTDGPFGITRNPMYLANTLLLLGVGFVSGITWFVPLALVAAFITRKIAIEKEERWLAEKFGKRYRDYAKRVRRWI
ncbi:MAG: isoprenylcysteine carboxylmethyltransferase family protein [Hyphomicrobiales bacterium]|nr:isoprenylcysteine carboxylmethyltransferase family protein [Hyphomicrobiales bacterium]